MRFPFENTGKVLVLAAAFLCAACGPKRSESNRPEADIPLADLESPPLEGPDPLSLNPEPASTESTRDAPAPARSAAPSGNPRLAALVETLQRQLAGKGFDPGPVDGIFGEQTDAALRSFQTVNGLAGTGAIDGATIAAIFAQESPASEEIQPVRGEDVPTQELSPAPGPRGDLAGTLGPLGAGIAFGILSLSALVRFR